MSNISFHKFYFKEIKLSTNINLIYFSFNLFILVLWQSNAKKL